MVTADRFRTGERVPKSGIYRVFHDRYHTGTHEVTCVCGERFPVCNRCGYSAQFQLVKAAEHVLNSEYFRKS